MNSIERKITTKRAREILGDKARNLTDKQIDIILGSLYALSVRIVQNLKRPI